MLKNILIVGAGFSGAVIAERLSKTKKYNIVVIDKRVHIGGNCHTEIDPETKILVHKYGPHIFNTNNLNVWNYIRTFGKFNNFTNRIKVNSRGSIYSFPINLHTINQFFNVSLSPSEATQLIDKKRDKSIIKARNFEEQALGMIGRDLYEAFIYGYTKKQWGCDPELLPASILKRVPVRFNYNDNYYDKLYQGIPEQGYSKIIENMLDHKSIRVVTDTPFNSSFDTSSFDHVFYTGPIDSFFDYKYGKLGYRTVTFEEERTIGDYQGNAVINYADLDVPYTRIHEHKHFAKKANFGKTIYFKEFSKETEIDDEPYYPKRLKDDKESLEKYQKDIEKKQNFTFLGRLGTYRYMDMELVISEALRISRNFKI
ncbi:MAG: UDP-galactopyranose mutase [Maribacter sp.]